jgi:DNA-binding CsgD family transcriptional regulator
MAAKLYDNAEKAGKQVTPGNIAYYAIQHAKSGRRAYGQSKTEPLHPSTQLNGRARLSNFEDAVKTEEGSEDPMLLTEVFSNEQEDPSTKAARNLDWESFMSSLNDRCQAILNVMAEGGQLKELAKTLKVSTSTLNTSRNQLKAKLLEFFGSDILKEIATMPQWRTNLLAHREMLACREERMPA